MSWLEEMSKAYEARPIIKVTPAMVTAGMQALDGGLQDTADLVFRTMMQGQPPMEVTTRMKQTGTEVMFSIRQTHEKCSRICDRHAPGWTRA